jgi:hypothetical protein
VLKDEVGVDTATSGRLRSGVIVNPGVLGFIDMLRACC